MDRKSPSFIKFHHTSTNLRFFAGLAGFEHGKWWESKGFNKLSVLFKAEKASRKNTPHLPRPTIPSSLKAWKIPGKKKASFSANGCPDAWRNRESETRVEGSSFPPRHPGSQNIQLWGTSTSRSWRTSWKFHPLQRESSSAHVSLAPSLSTSLTRLQSWHSYWLLFCLQLPQDLFVVGMAEKTALLQRWATAQSCGTPCSSCVSRTSHSTGSASQDSSRSSKSASTFISFSLGPSVGHQQCCQAHPKGLWTSWDSAASSLGNSEAAFEYWNAPVSNSSLCWQLLCWPVALLHVRGSKHIQRKVFTLPREAIALALWAAECSGNCPHFGGSRAEPSEFSNRCSSSRLALAPWPCPSSSYISPPHRASLPPHPSQKWSQTDFSGPAQGMHQPMQPEDQPQPRSQGTRKSSCLHLELPSSQEDGPVRWSGGPLSFDKMRFTFSSTNMRRFFVAM